MFSLCPMSSTYFILMVHSLPRKDEEIFVSSCFDQGCEGVAEALPFSHEPRHFGAKPEERPLIDLQVYFTAPPSEDFLEQMTKSYPQANFSVKEEVVRDWQEEWRKSFKSFRLVDEMWVVPSWETPDPHMKTLIRLDPGMAFGTGTHETTQVCCELICEEMKSPQGGKISSSFDVGTGSGLLTIVLNKLGISDLCVSEIDDLALKVAFENFEMNQVSGVKIYDPKNPRTFDLVVANIVDGVLTELKPSLLGALSPSGTLILSGIWHERQEAFEEAFFKDLARTSWQSRRRGDWFGYVYRANP